MSPAALPLSTVATWEDLLGASPQAEANPLTNSDSTKTGRRRLNSRRPENAGSLVPSSSVNPRRRTMFVGAGRKERAALMLE